MNVVTHLLASWAIAAGTQRTRRDRALVTWAGVAPDLDGIGIVVDFATRTLGFPGTDFYRDYHRLYGHGLPAAAAFTGAAAAAANDRVRVALYSFATVHLHLLFDVLGSRGTMPEDLWSIHYLSPLSQAWTFTWSGQWPLVSWQNTAITVLLVLLALFLAVRRGVSPAELFHKASDERVVAALRARWSAITARGLR